MRVFMFHLMPYAYMDMNYEKKWDSPWVIMPNSEYDPKKGHELYNRYLDELELAAELGLDGEGLEGLGAEISGDFGDDFGADFDMTEGERAAKDAGEES